MSQMRNNNAKWKINKFKREHLTSNYDKVIEEVKCKKRIRKRYISRKRRNNEN